MKSAFFHSRNFKVADLYRGVVPFIILQLIGLALIIVWPAIVTWLPAIAYKP